MNSSIHNVAIVGVAGTVGTYITKALLAKNRFTITAITRHGSTAEFLPGVKVALVDYNDQGSIIEALVGKDALVITTSVWAPKDTSTKLIKAAAAAKVPWILPNEFGMYNTDEAAEETVGPGKREDRELIESLGVSSWVGISCGFWYAHSLSNGQLFGIDIGKRNIIFFDDGTQRLNTSTLHHAGSAAAAVLCLPSDALEAYRNRMVFVSSFAVSQKDMFESVKRTTGTTTADWNITYEPAKERYQEACEMLKKGDRIAFGRKLYTRYFIEDAGLFEKRHGLDNSKLGLSQEDLDEATQDAVNLVNNGYWSKYGQH